MMERRSSISQDGDNSYDNRQAKQRATVKWLLSKAYNNKVPDNVREPFYKDHENQEHLKPQLVHSLSNAELYCMALSNIYTDPNYHNLNHWGILRALNNKGIYPDKRLTETVLIQTNPLKLSAHLSVMEALMSLYAKEVATPDRVVAAVQRFSPSKESVSLPADHEAALVLWINEAVTALNMRISQESAESNRREFKCVKDLHELSDGVAMAALVAFYCPEDLPHTSIVMSKVPTVSDCVKNLLLVYNFCMKCLPHPIFHMMAEDVGFMRGSMRSNLVVFLADLFNLLEINPAQCVRFDRGAAPLIEVQPLALSSPSISKRHSNATGAEVNGDDSSFVVHRGKSIPTLSSMLHHNNNNNGSGDNVPAGKPSNWEDNRGKTYYAGRRSRRNSLSDESQLTVENFGGSQDNLNFIGRNPDKQVAVHVGSREPVITQSPRVIAQENRNSTSVINILAEAQNDEPIDTSRYTSRSNSISLSTPLYTPSSRGTTRAAADNASSAGLQNLLYDEPSPPSTPTAPTSESVVVKRGSAGGAVTNSTPEKRMSTFATLPNSNKTTTWQQQSTGSSENQSHRNTDEGGVDTSQLLNIRMELEEKRRQIEMEKRRAEVVINKQRQKMGKAAFFQAVSKSKGSLNSSPSSSSLKTPDSDPGKEATGKEEEVDIEEPDSLPPGPPAVRSAPYQDMSEVEQKWSENNGSHATSYVDNRKTNNNTPETLIDQYQHSIAQIQEMQCDIQRLTQQQNSYHPHHQAPSHTMLQQPALIQQPTIIQQPVTLHSFANSAATQQPLTMNYYHSNQSPAPVYQPVISCDIAHQQQPVQWSNNMYPGPPMNYTPSPPPHQNPMIPPHMLPLSSSASPSPPHHEVYQQQHYQQPNQYSQQQYNSQQPANYSQHLSQKQDSQSIAYSNQDRSKSQNYFHQQHEQVDRLIRSNDPNQMNSSEAGERFYLHDPPSNMNSNTQRKSWNTPSSPMNFLVNSKGNQQDTNSSTRNVWNNRNEIKVNHISKSPSSNNFASQNGNSRDINTREEGAPTPPPRRSSQISHAPIPAPPPDDMEPQSISYIGDDDSELSEGLSKMNITSGSRTYRIPSPTRSHVRNSISSHSPVSLANLNSSPGPAQPEKGFYISFDDDVAPKRPKPPLRAKKSPKKDRGLTQVVLDSYLHNIENQSSHLNDNGPPPLPLSSPPSHSHPPSKPNVIHTSPPKDSRDKYSVNTAPSSHVNHTNEKLASRESGALIIDPELVNPDPVTMDEMERKKERIMLQSLQRRQQQEEMKIRKELEAQRRRDIDKRKADEKDRKKSEMEQRRAAILEQHRIKKALEKAEMEGDKELLYSLKALQQNMNPPSNNSGPPRLRGKPSTTRPRPKTIHIDNHSTSDMHDGMLTPSRGNKGSSSNLSVFSNASSANTSMRRDYYRGSQDCLAETRRTSSASFISDFGDDSRGTSPGRTVGRRGSYKTTSRDPSPSYSEHSRTSSLHRRTPLRQPRSRYQSRPSSQPPRKSNSLMNLSGSSCDQDSMLYRGDTDSGLGLGTPSRRAPSPHHPSSPSGPGSLPLHRIRSNRCDDTVSESGSDYCGPRLYKQPTTKSNRGIILNAVEYCVFPGAVNRDAKNRVLDEIHRSETRHFLILFRDARCQFRALYAYTPDCEDGQEVVKLYGTGPKLVTDRMFDQFFKYNSGGKSFTQIHTKHLTVTIDAFTIHNSLWQGKKVNLPNKRDMSLVI